MEELRQTAALANSRAIALEFVKRYYARVGRSPSHREISAGTRLSRRQVQSALHALADAGEILLRPGHHGIVLPDPVDQLSEGDVLMLLAKRGFVVNGAFPVGTDPVTFPCLPLLGELEHIPDVIVGGELGAGDIAA